MTDRPVIVQTFEHAIAAHAACARLEASGIETRVFDEHVVTLDPLLGNALGGIKVCVRSSDLAAARQVLDQKVAADPDACPRCGSSKVERHDAARRAAFLTMILLSLPIGRARARMRCAECDHSWRD